MEPQPFQTGPCADIFRGTLEGKQVALKRLQFPLSEVSRRATMVREIGMCKRKC
jgi:hypothetical protein